jgi:hypothetical protein
MNKKRNFIAAAIVLLLSLAFFGCENTPEDEKAPEDKNIGSGASGEIDTLSGKDFFYNSSGFDFSKLLGWSWGISGTEKNGLDYTDYDFKWIFQTDGTISAVHCCGAIFHDQYSYFFNGNLFVLCGSEMEDDKIYITTLTMADDDLSFTVKDLDTSKEWRSFIRDQDVENYLGNSDWAFKTQSSDLKLTNNLIGTWKGEDGKKYVFGTDTTLKIGSDQYKYLVRDNVLLTLGPLVDGKTAVFQKYVYIKNNTKKQLYLQSTKDGIKSTITLSAE